MCAAERSYTWEDYYIPGTQVLRNLFTGPEKPFGEPNESILDLLETGATAFRLAELSIRPVSGRFDYAHMKAIHRHLFQDVYEWASRERTAPTQGPMTKAGHRYYSAGPGLTAAAQAEFTRLERRNYLRRLTRDRFISELAEVWGELNVVHSFREGNTRTQLVFFAQLSQRAGYFLVSRLFTIGSPLRERFVHARFYGQDTGDHRLLGTVLEDVIFVSPPETTQR